MQQNVNMGLFLPQVQLRSRDEELNRCQISSSQNEPLNNCWEICQGHFWKLVSKHLTHDVNPKHGTHTRVHTHTHTHNGKLLSHKKEGNNAICSNMAGPWDYHTKRSKSDQERQYYMGSPICGIYQQWYNRTSSQNTNRLKDFETKLTVTKGETLGGGRN